MRPLLCWGWWTTNQTKTAQTWLTTNSHKSSKLRPEQALPPQNPQSSLQARLLRPLCCLRQPPCCQTQLPSLPRLWTPGCYTVFLMPYASSLSGSWYQDAHSVCSVPYTLSTNHAKRASTAGHMQSAKVAKTATGSFPSSQRQQQKPAAPGLLLPPQLRGRSISCFSASNAICCNLTSNSLCCVCMLIELQSVGQMHLQKIWSGLGLQEPDLPRSLKASGETSCVHYSSFKKACTEGIASPSVEFLTGVEVSVPAWAQSQCMQHSSLIFRCAVPVLQHITVSWHHCLPACTPFNASHGRADPKITP